MYGSCPHRHKFHGYPLDKVQNNVILHYFLPIFHCFCQFYVIFNDYKLYGHTICPRSEFYHILPWFFTFVFRNVPGTVPECVRICGFKRNSYNLDRAPKKRDSVLLNSWDSFLVTLPSISLETCVIQSSLILRTDVFRDGPFLGCSSCVFLVTAANFRLFLNVAIF